MRYTIEITEQLVKSFEVEAENPNEALRKIAELYYTKRSLLRVTQGQQ